MQATLELSELDTKIGQLFMAGMPGPSLDPHTEELIKSYGLGGIILFSRNIESPFQVAELCLTLQRMAMESQGRPLFLAVDQEGGRVSRLGEGFTQFPGNELLAKADDPEQAASDFAKTTAHEMSLVGLNMNLAPVVDVHRQAPEAHLEGRTFGSNPKLASNLGRIIIEGFQKAGIMAVAKHFPGLGAAKSDPHRIGLIINEPIEELEKIDLPPFKKAIACGVAGIMSSHACYPALDPDAPATMSYPIMTKLLREYLGFSGVALTDDLEMGAITEKSTVSQGACKAFEAGADILLICKSQEKVFESIFEMRKRLLHGWIKLERLYLSLSRIKRIKAKFLTGILEPSLSHVKEYFG